VRCASAVSALFYLNDDFEGGQTRFYCGSKYDPESVERPIPPDGDYLDLIPTAGSCWIGDQDLYHQGMKVQGVKFVAKLNILYTE